MNKLALLMFLVACGKSSPHSGSQLDSGGSGGAPPGSGGGSGTPGETSTGSITITGEGNDPMTMSAFLSTLSSSRNGFASVGWSINFSMSPPGSSCEGAIGGASLDIFTNAPGPSEPTLPANIDLQENTPCMSQTVDVPIGTFDTGQGMLLSGKLTLTSESATELVGSVTGVLVGPNNANGPAVTATFDAPLCAQEPLHSVDQSSGC